MTAPRITRRDFHRLATASVAAPFFLPAAARGANERLNLGSIGIGRMAARSNREPCTL